MADDDIIEADQSFYEFEITHHQPENWEPTLQAMLELKSGWNGYTAASPGLWPVEEARKFIAIAASFGLYPHRVMASAMGGVGITFTRGGSKEVYVEFLNHGAACMACSDAKTKTCFTKSVNLSDVMDDYADTVERAKVYLADLKSWP